MIRSTDPPRAVAAIPPAQPAIGMRQAEAILGIVESAPQVRRRYQFFVWAQSQLHALLPHQVLVCGAYHRQQRELAFEVFQSIVLDEALVAALVEGQGALLRPLQVAWIEGRGQPLYWPLVPRPPALPPEWVDALRGAGIESLLAHGVARPQRPSEIESFFVLADAARPGGGHAALHLDLMLPHLHATWLRVIAAEREIAPAVPRSPVRPAPPEGGVTARERQILSWVREGKSNQQIAEVLGISPLTVKNHVQKILRKLGASNRAQAVAVALQRGLIEGSVP